MIWQITPYAIPLFIGALLLALVSIALLRDSTPSARYLIAANLAIIFYLVGYGLELGQVTTAGALFWLKIEYLGIPLISPLLLMLALVYSGEEKWLAGANRYLLLVIPILTISLAWTNEYHGWVWQDLTLIPSGPLHIAEFTAGPWYWVNIGFMFASAIAAVVLLIWNYRRSPDLFRSQIRVLLFGFALPIAAQVAYTGMMLARLPVLKINWQAYAFALSGLIISMGIRRYKLFDIGPVAYSAIFESIEDLIIVLDSYNRVVDFNTSAAAFLEWERSSAIGAHLRELVTGEQLAFIQQFRDKTSVHTAVTFEEHVFDLRISELHSQRGKTLGTLVVFRDITNRTRMEQALEEREEHYRKLVEDAGDIVFLTSPTGYFEYVNPKAEVLTGYTREELVGTLFTELIHPEWREEVQRFYLDQRDDAISESTREFPIITRQGETKWVEQVVTLLYAAGEVSGMQGVVRDVSERVRAEQALRENERRYRSLFDHTIDAIFLLNLDLTHMAMNPRAAEMLGYTPEELIGRSISEIIAPDEFTAAKHREAQLYEDEILPVYERTFIHKDGHKVPTEISAALIRDENGEPLYIQSVVRDISERLRSQQALRENERRFRSLFENTTDAVFLVNLESNHFAVNQRAADMLGYTIEELVGMPSSQVIAPVEAEESKQKLTQLYDQGILPVYERTFVRKDGVHIPTELSVSLIRDDDGSPLYIQSMARDITERVQTREQLRLQATALEATANGIVITDAEGVILWVNPAFTALTGYTSKEVLGQTPRILKSGKQSDEVYDDMWATIKAGKVWRGQVVNRRKDKSLYHEEMTITPVYGEDGKITRFIAIKQDISARVEAEEKLRHSATHDPVTDLPNRVLLYDRLATAIARSKRGGGQFSVLFIDLDNFKLVNDHAGHERGDWLLKTIGDRLLGVLRATDTVARWGGDEFVIILESIADLDQVIVRIQDAASFHLDHQGERIQVTPSIGIACYPGDGQDSETLLKRADNAMYLAKENGGNQHRFYSEELENT